MSAEDIRVPPAILLGAAAVALFTIGASVTARQVDEGLFRSSLGEVSEARKVRFSMNPDGTMDAASPGGEPLARFFPEGNTFAIVAVEALAKRANRPVGEEGAVFEVARAADDTVALKDPATGATVLLRGFGPDNVETLARLLAAD